MNKDLLTKTPISFPPFTYTFPDSGRTYTIDSGSISYENRLYIKIGEALISIDGLSKELRDLVEEFVMPVYAEYDV